MIDHSDSSGEGASGPVLLVTVAEGPDALPEVAFLAGAIKAAGLEAVRFPADFCSDERVFEARLRELNPGAVWFHYATEWREMAARGAELAVRTVEAPVCFAGSAADAGRDGVLPVPLIPGVQVPPSQHEEDLVLPAGGRRIEAARIVPDWSIFGPDLSNRPVSTSLFARPGSIGCLASREALAARPPTALLARLGAPRRDGMWNLPPDVLARCIASFEGFDRVEWWDRNFGPRKLQLLPIAREAGLRQSVRLLGAGAGKDHLSALRDGGVDEVVFESDRVDSAPPLPGSSASVRELAPCVEAARRLGLDASLLLVLGLPGETAGAARARIAAARQMGLRHVRCIPFEPAGGHPAFAAVAAAGLLPPEGGRWKREVHRPLKQECLSTGEFVEIWAEGMLLHAETEMAERRPGP